MDTVTTELNSGTVDSKLKHWIKLITVTGSAQILVQALGLISGILIIRLLPTKEYAFYTLANTMLGTMTILADGGIGAGVMAQGGKVWQDKEKLGSVLVTGYSLRKKFAIGSLIIAVPTLLYLLLHNGSTWLKAIIIVGTLIPAFIAALSDSLLEISLKLRQEINPLQKNQIWVAFVRMLFVFPLYFSPFAAIAVIANGIPRILGNIKLRKLISTNVNLNQKADPTVQKNILKGVARILPGAIYYCVSGQITIWLISIFGNSKAIAQVGALSRLTMILTLVTTIFNTLAIPRFSRLSNYKRALFSNFFKIIAALAGFSIIVVGVVWLFPKFFLMILGNGYMNISSELVLSVIGSCLSLSAGIIYSMSTCRGWLISPFIYIPVNVLCIIITVLVFKVDTLQGALMINIVTSSVQVLMNIFYCLIKISKN
ncbi:polysaccharide biosynthesis protein [Mucilaginibacter sp. KACC 22063]|uniref:polysaccharide biosynthesis protein n=1 Tax=Mucilaginibacter sp. KACC 22063 TaxID=3025666 RepID=UPI002366627E|nr:polysaccharide biosynthesis protein [Mucilaginibacter sp. KACC 22063]WDF54466.1 polysaccharide biosynthesis protein [Mucilaginibacter sp. KACC 22063]